MEANHCKQLAIHEHIEKILALIENNLIVQINSATETGKKVFVSVPTRISATSLCNYLHYLNPNISVGYAAEGNSMYDYDTQVVYATSEHMKRKLLGYFSRDILQSKRGLCFTDILILDETH